MSSIIDNFTICLNEMLDYIGDVPEEDDDEDEDYYYNYDRETEKLVNEIKSALDFMVGMNI